MAILILFLAVGFTIYAVAAQRERLRVLEQQVSFLSERLAAAEPLPQPAPPLQTAVVKSGVERPASEPARNIADVPMQSGPLDPDDPATDDGPERDSIGALFERFVGGRLLIWVGGIALAVSGIFLVRYSIELGLVTPKMRMIAAGLFGLALIAAGEAARARPSIADEPRIAQALAGAGILVLYASSYGAFMLYQLIAIGAASALMTATTIAALGLSLRHGAPTAVLGLAGGFLTPLLVGNPDSGAVPLLGYLALLNIALFALARRHGWSWLAIASIVLSFLWTAALLGTSSGDAVPAGISSFSCLSQPRSCGAATKRCRAWRRRPG